LINVQLFPQIMYNKAVPRITVPRLQIILYQTILIKN